MGNSSVKTVNLNKNEILELSKNKLICFYDNKTKTFYFDDALLIHIDILIDEYKYNDNFNLQIYYSNKIIYAFKCVEGGFVYNSNKLIFT